jgi:hypothetical protein
MFLGWWRNLVRVESKALRAAGQDWDESPERPPGVCGRLLAPRL